MGSAVLLGLSFLSKLFSLFLLPFIIQRSGKKLLFFLSFSAVIAFFSPYYLVAGKNLFGGLLAYSAHWRFNDSLFPLVEWTCSRMGLHHLYDNTAFSSALPKGITAAIYLGVLSYFAWKKKEASLLRISYWSIGLLLLLAPTFHFWYLTWMLPFLALFPNRAWILLTGTIMLSQEVLVGYSLNGVWEEKGWIKLMEFLPFYLLLFLDYFVKHKFLNVIPCGTIIGIGRAMKRSCKLKNRLKK